MALILGVNVLILIALLFILELSFRYFNAFPQTGVQSYSFERFIDLKEFVPSVEVSEYAESLEAIELKSISVKSPCKADSNGLLSSYGPGLNHERILILGDAQMCHLDLTDTQRIHHVLFQELDSSFHVLNAAFPGSDLIHSTNKVVNTLLPLRPKMAIINHNISDLLILAKHGSYWGKILGDKKKARVWITPISSEPPQIWVPDSVILKEYTNAMRNLAQLLSNWHIKPVFLTQAIQQSDTLGISELLRARRINISTQRLLALHKQINQEIRELCHRNNWAIIDIEDELGQSEEYFNNYLYLSPIGVHKMAQQIGDSLMRWEIISRRNV